MQFLIWTIFPCTLAKMGKRRADQSHDLPSKSKRLSDESKLLVDPEKPWYLVKIKETWEITGPRPDAAGEIDTVLNKAIQVYESQVRNFRSRNQHLPRFLGRFIILL